MNEIYSIKEKERKAFVRSILTPIGKSAKQLPQYDITGFLSMVGYNYNHELMVIGRSVNGWTDGINPEALTSSEAMEKFSKRVVASVSGGEICPMTWVSKKWGIRGGSYNTKRSAFWRVIRSVVAKLKIADTNEKAWPSHLVWSNLYKVAPYNGGNPDSRLRNVQFEGCVELLKLYTAH